MKYQSDAFRVACLPVAGPENPYQSLMIEGLNQPNIQAFTGINDRFLGIIRTQLRYKPDYIHFDWIVSYYYRRWSLLTLFSILLFCLQLEWIYRCTPTRIVWTLHNLLPHDLPLRFFHRFCQRFMAKRCHWIRVFSEDTVTTASKELQVPLHRFHVIPEGDYSSIYPNESSTNEAREKLDIPITAQLLLFFGTIRPYKGILDLFQVIHQIDNPDLMFLIAGHIPDQSYAQLLQKELPAGCILHPNFISKEQLHYYFNAADAVVIPFIEIENSGSAILAMGFGKPIIAPAKGALPKRLHTQSQLLYDSKVSLKQAIIKVLHYSDDVRKQIGERNIHALKNYQWADFGRLFH
jgi:beta-1,4-mannosyltransferase